MFFSAKGTVVRKESVKAAEWAGSITGLLGSALLATNSQYSGYGFIAFLASNIFWIYFSYKTKTHSLLTMQAGFTLTSVVGIARWFH